MHVAACQELDVEVHGCILEISMQNYAYLPHGRHVAVHQAHEPHYGLHESAEQLDGCPEVLVQDGGFDGSRLDLVALLVSPPIPLTRHHSLPRSADANQQPGTGYVGGVESGVT